MKLHGEDIAVGDRVFETDLEAYVTVVEVTSGAIVVRTKRSTRRYGSDGRRPDGVRSLYWHDPIIALPAKDEANWNRASETLLAVTSFVCDLVDAKAEDSAT